jgi:hypothetical protein
MNFVGVKAAGMWYAEMNQKGDMCESGYSVESINCDVKGIAAISWVSICTSSKF